MPNPIMDMDEDELTVAIAEAHGWMVKKISESPARYWACHFSVGSIGTTEYEALDEECLKTGERIDWTRNIATSMHLVDEIGQAGYVCAIYQLFKHQKAASWGMTIV